MLLSVFIRLDGYKYMHLKTNFLPVTTSKINETNDKTVTNISYRVKVLLYMVK